MFNSIQYVNWKDDAGKRRGSQKPTPYRSRTKLFYTAPCSQNWISFVKFHLTELSSPRFSVTDSSSILCVLLQHSPILLTLFLTTKDSYWSIRLLMSIFTSWHMRSIKKIHFVRFPKFTKVFFGTSTCLSPIEWKIFLMKIWYLSLIWACFIDF